MSFELGLSSTRRAGMTHHNAGMVTSRRSPTVGVGYASVSRGQSYNGNHARRNGKLIRRYFWAQDLSPLTAIRDERGAAVDAMKDRAEAVACGRDGMHGVVFQDKPDLSRWTLISHTRDTDQAVYKPKKNTKEGRTLARAIESVRTEYTREHEEEALRKLGLYAWLTVDRTFIRTTLGWAGDRVFVVVPWIVGADKNDGETVHSAKDNLTIPDWLTECSEFEMREGWCRMSTVLALALLHGAALILICRTSRVERMRQRLAKWRAQR